MLRHFKSSLSSSFFTPLRSFSTQLTHITDTEGTDALFKQIQNSQIIGLKTSGLYFKNTSPGTPYFIFGGDATDRGRHDLATTEMLVDFKKRFPEQVYLLAGNREIKNTRVAIELHPATIRERLIQTQVPYWLMQPSKPLDYLLAELKQKGKFSDKAPTTEELTNEVNALSIERCQLIYLRWMLEKTMGSPLTFNYRRHELSQARSGVYVSDYEVVESFLHETQPDGLMGQYLQHANIGIIIPETGILAVHGGLTKHNIGRTPDMSPEEPAIQDAGTWINALNGWFKKQIDSWKIRTTETPTSINQPGLTELDKSVLPVPGKHKYVITADMLNPKRQFVSVPTEVDSYLKQNNLHIVLTGHQPIGDHPCLIRGENSLFINGDTGYANGANNPDDTRGSATHQLEIFADKEAAQINIHATLSDATVVQTELVMTKSGIQGDPNIGTVLSDNRLVQCQLANGDYRLAEQQGFKVNYSTIKAENMPKMQNASLPTPGK